jgi:hypothetical protein
MFIPRQTTVFSAIVADRLRSRMLFFGIVSPHWDVNPFRWTILALVIARSDDWCTRRARLELRQRTNGSCSRLMLMAEIYEKLREVPA